MSKAEKKLRAKTGLDYRHSGNGQHMRVEAGDIVEGLNELATKNELEAGNVEWVEDEEEGDGQ